MARVKTSFVRRRRHKKILKATRGYYGQKSRSFKKAHEAYLRSLQYAYAHRRKKKGDMRRLWIIRINAAARQFGLSYSRFMHGLQKAGVKLDRKMLADLAIREHEAFSKLVELARNA